jgi:hypothetical protein
VSSSQEYVDGNGPGAVLNDPGSSTVRSAVKEFSFKGTTTQSRDRGIKDSKNSNLSVGTAKLGIDTNRSRRSPKKN